MKKRLLGLMLVLALVMALFAGCSSATTTEAAPAAEPAATEPTESAAQAPTPAEAPSAEPEAEEIPAEAPVEGTEAPAPEASAPESPAPEAPAENPEGPPPESPVSPEAVDSGYDYTWHRILPESDTPEIVTVYGKEINLMGDLGTLGIHEFNQFDYWPNVIEKTGVDLEVTYISFFAWSELYQLWIAAGDYTDIVIGGSYTGGLEQGVEDDVVLDYTDYVQDLMPNYYHRIMDHGYYENTTINDRWLSVISMYDAYKVNEGLLLRKDWLDNLGMDIPSTWDEFHDVLLAVKETYNPDWTVYIDQSCTMGHYGGYTVPFYGVGGTSIAFYLDDGEIKSGLLSQEYKDYITRLNGYWNDGLLNPDFLNTQADTHSQVFTSAVLTDNMFMWGDNLEGITTFMGYDVGPDFELAPLVGPLDFDGQKDVNTALNPGDMEGYMFTVEALDNLEATLSFVDFWFSDDGADIYNYGCEGLDFVYDENGEPQWTDAMIHNPFGMTVVGYARCRCPYGSLGGYAYRNRTVFEYGQTQLDAWEVWTAIADGSNALPSNLTMDLELSNEQTTIMSDICTFADTYIAQFVIGQRSIDEEWDSFIETLHNMNINRAIEIEQITIDEHNNR